MSKSNAEEAFARAWERIVPGPRAAPEREYRFHVQRRWRFDFAWPTERVALEIEGRGRHQTVAGTRRDCEKYNTATLMGWRVLRVPATDVGGVQLWVELVWACLTGAGEERQNA